MGVLRVEEAFPRRSGMKKGRFQNFDFQRSRRVVSIGNQSIGAGMIGDSVRGVGGFVRDGGSFAVSHKRSREGVIGNHSKRGEVISDLVRRQIVTRRDGGLFTIFIANISKRISKMTLWKAFEIYGAIGDIFIAYRSLKHRLNNSTFAFVRFKEEDGLNRAIREGDNRVLDGFVIRVFRANKRSVVNPRPISIGADRFDKRRIDLLQAVRDTRTYKEAVLGTIFSDAEFPHLLPNVGKEKEDEGRGELSMGMSEGLLQASRKKGVTIEDGMSKGSVGDHDRQGVSADSGDSFALDELEF